MAACIVCNGMGKQLNKVCNLCHGRKTITPSQVREFKTYQKTWCNCKSNIGTYFVKADKHLSNHWRCNSCKKIIQTCLFQQ